MSKGNAGGDLRRFYIVFGAVAAIGIAVVGYTLVSSAVNRAATVPIDLEGIDDLQRLTQMAVPVTFGDADAPATIIVFSDYLCNHCAEFSLRHRPLVEEAFVATGRARLVLYDFPLNPAQGSFIAARAARCAEDQGMFIDYHDTLYRNQRTFALAPDQIGWLEDIGDRLGLDSGEFRGCLNSDRHAEAITANLELARALALDGTPAVMVGTGQGMSRRLNSYAFDVISAAVEAVLSGS